MYINSCVWTHTNTGGTTYTLIAINLSLIFNKVDGIRRTTLATFATLAGSSIEAADPLDARITAHQPSERVSAVQCQWIDELAGSR